MFSFRDALKLLLILAVILLFFFLKDIFMLAFLGVLFCVIFSFPVGFLKRWMPRGAAVLLTLVIFGSGVAGIFMVGMKPLHEEIVQINDAAPEAIGRFKHWFQKAQQDTPMNQIAPEAGTKTLQKKATELQESILDKTGDVAIGLTSALTAMLIVIVLAAFFVHEPQAYYESMKAMIPRRYEQDLAEIWERLSTGLRHWLGGTIVAMALMGSVAGIGLWAIGVHDYLLLAILTFFGTFIPYVGAISSAVPGLLIALSQSTHLFLAAAGVYLGVHIIEGYIVQPIIMKKAVVISPAMLLIWQFAIGAFGGILGIIIATPLLVVLKIIIGYFYIEKRLGKEAPCT